MFFFYFFFQKFFLPSFSPFRAQAKSNFENVHFYVYFGNSTQITLLNCRRFSSHRYGRNVTSKNFQHKNNSFFSGLQKLREKDNTSGEGIWVENPKCRGLSYKISSKGAFRLPFSSDQTRFCPESDSWPRQSASKKFWLGEFFSDLFFSAHKKKFYGIHHSAKCASHDQNFCFPQSLESI